MKKLFRLALVLLVILAAGAAVIAFRRPRVPPEPGAATPETGGGLPKVGERATPVPETTGVLTPACPAQWGGLADGDADGLPDPLEARYGTDEANADTDSDGFRDGEEVRAGYDPLRKEGNPRLDSDGDGLRDDEECVWKTNPFTADTDGDSFADGDEVRNLFDPTAKGDGKGSDALPERRARALAADLERFRPRADSDNLTERLAATLFGDRPIGELTTYAPSEAEIARALDSFPRDTSLPTVSLTELTLGTSNTAPDLQRYLTDLVRAQGVPPDASTQARALSSSLTGDSSLLADIRTALESYEQRLRAVTVPPSAVPYHRDLVALTRYTTHRFLAVETYAQSDPVRAHLAIRELTEGLPAQAARAVALRQEVERLAGS